ncbi:MAG: hypothetical protein ACLFV6_14645 [Spirulinaceae cyanobacterium]
MAKDLIEIEIQTNTFSRDNEARNEDTAKLKRTYTAKEMGRLLGTSDRNISQRWEPMLLEIFDWRVEEFRQGNRFTAIALEEFQKLQAAISPKIPKRDDLGSIVRDDKGKPLMVKNPNRIGFEAYKAQVWSECDREPTEIVPGELCDEDSLAEQENTLAVIDSVGTEISDLFEKARGAGAEMGRDLAGVALEEASASFRETFQSGLSAMAQAMASPKKKS